MLSGTFQSKSIKLNVFSMLKKIKSHRFYIIFTLLVIIRLLIVLVIPLTSLHFKEYDKFNFYLYSWNRWDAPHYIYLSENWYTNFGDESNFIVFPPLFPVVIKLLNYIFNQSIFSAMIVSNISYLISLLIIYKLLKKDFSENTAFGVIILMSVFPTSYFFSSPYAESLFLLFVSSSFLLFRKGRYLEAGIFGGLSYLTRHFGLLILPGYLLFLLLKTKKGRLKNIVLLAMPYVFAISLYLLLNYVLFSDPLKFFKILKNHWYKDFEFPWVGIINSFKRGFVPFSQDSIFIGLSEAFASIILWLFIPLSFVKLPIYYWVYYLLGTISATSTGFLLSTPRYILSIFPFFLILSLIVKNLILRMILGAIFILLLGYLTGIYLSGVWAF